MKVSALLFAALAGCASADFDMHPYDPLPDDFPVQETTMRYIRDQPRPTTHVHDEPRPTTARAGIDTSCSDCVDRQRQGENISCLKVCQKDVVVGETTIAALGGNGDVCYQMCEDNSAPFIERDCAAGLYCTAPNTGMVSFDSCGELAYTCRPAPAVAETTAKVAAGPAGLGDVCSQFCEDGSLPAVHRNCAAGLECRSTLPAGTMGFDTCGTSAWTCELTKSAATTPKKKVVATKPVDPKASTCDDDCNGECYCQWWECDCVEPVIDPVDPVYPVDPIVDPVDPVYPPEVIEDDFGLASTTVAAELP